MILTPLILEYLRRYPDMNLVLVTEGRLVDVVGQGFDAGIRLAEIVPQDMIAVPIGPQQRMLVVGSPDYFERHARPKVLEDLLHQRCIRARLASGAIWHWEFERGGGSGGDRRAGIADPRRDDAHDRGGCAGRRGSRLSQRMARWPGISPPGDWSPYWKTWTPRLSGLCPIIPVGATFPAGLRALIDLIRDVNAGQWRMQGQ